MKQIYLLLLTGSPFLTSAQHVGVGTSTPAEKLDVIGNIQLSGKLKLNGNAGSPGEVLQVNADGSQAWASIGSAFKNRSVFLIPGTFTVPAGVTRLMIEAVGSGGGGARGGGGGGGAYIIAIVKVAPGSNVSYSVSDVAIGAAAENSPGATNNGSSAAGTGFSIRARSGSPGYADGAGTGGDAIFSGDSLQYVQLFSGGAGSATTESYSQYASTQFVTERYYGNGGACPYNPWSVSRGSFLSFNTATLANVRLVYGNIAAGVNAVGAGGAGGNTSQGQWGFSGCAGLVAISW